MTVHHWDSDSVGYDPLTETYHAVHDWDSSEPITTTVISAVSAVTNEPPLEMEPLFGVVDPDALVGVLRPDGGGYVTVSFRFEGHDVAVDTNGNVFVDVSECASVEN